MQSTKLRNETTFFKIKHLPTQKSNKPVSKREANMLDLQILQFAPSSPF